MGPTEAEYARRLIDKITTYFRYEGYAVNAQTVDKSKTETSTGTDIVFSIGTKLWGIQAKRPNNKKYSLDLKQHNNIKNNTWIDYAFPEELHGSELNNILHRTHFSRGKFTFKKQVALLDIKDKESWSDVAEKIKSCKKGKIIESEEDIKKLSKELQDFIKTEGFFFYNVNIKEHNVMLYVTSIELLNVKRYPSIKEKIGYERRQLIEKEKKCPHCGRPI